MKYLVMMICAAVMLTGCVANSTKPQVTGKPFDYTLVNQIEKGKSTKADVEALFGKPYYTAVGENGKSTWTYSYSENYDKSTMFENKYDLTSRILQVLFAGEVVEDFAYNEM